LNPQSKADIQVIYLPVQLLLFIGIHNAWDTVAYHVLVKQAGSENVGKTWDFYVIRAFRPGGGIPPDGGYRRHP
jgi:hypothetical protein